MGNTWESRRCRFQKKKTMSGFFLLYRKLQKKSGCDKIEMKHNGMANRANRGIRDDVSYEVVFGESMTTSYVTICSSCLCGIATHGAHGSSFPSKDRKGNYRDIPGNRNQYAGYFPLWWLSYSIIPYIRMKFEQNGLGLSVRSRWQTVSCGGENK